MKMDFFINKKVKKRPEKIEIYSYCIEFLYHHAQIHVFAYHHFAKLVSYLTAMCATAINSAG